MVADVPDTISSGQVCIMSSEEMLCTQPLAVIHSYKTRKGKLYGTDTVSSNLGEYSFSVPKVFAYIMMHRKMLTT